jgi:hypothetical protein
VPEQGVHPIVYCTDRVARVRTVPSWASSLSSSRQEECSHSRPALANPCRAGGALRSKEDADIRSRTARVRLLLRSARPDVPEHPSAQRPSGIKQADPPRATHHHSPDAPPSRYEPLQQLASRVANRYPVLLLCLVWRANAWILALDTWRRYGSQDYRRMHQLRNLRRRMPGIGDQSG